MAATTRTAWILPTTILGSSLGFIDSSVVTVALPALQHAFHASVAQIQWIVNSYLVTLASLILFGGSGGDRFGYRRMFQIGLVGFGAASVLCGLAPRVAWLIGARLIQGAAAAMLTPSSLAMLGSAYSGEERDRAIGTWAGAAALTTALGPPFGGWMLDHMGWRAIFFINPPIAACALLASLKTPDNRPQSDAPLDAKGAIWAFLALALISYGLIAVGQRQRVTGVLALMVAFPALWLLKRTEQRARAPMMPLSLFRSREFSGINAQTLLLYAALGGALFVLPFVLINAYRYSASAAGFALLPFAILMGVGSGAAGAIAGRFGPRPSLIGGSVVAGCGYTVLALSIGLQRYWMAFLPGLLLVGIGMTLAVPPLTATVFDSVPEDRGGVASGVNNTAARAGSLIAVAALGLAFVDVRASPGAASLIAGYRTVMMAAAAAALLCGVIAARTIRAGRR